MDRSDKWWLVDDSFSCSTLCRKTGDDIHIYIYYIYTVYNIIIISYYIYTIFFICHNLFFIIHMLILYMMMVMIMVMIPTAWPNHRNLWGLNDLVVSKLFCVQRILRWSQLTRTLCWFFCRGDEKPQTSHCSYCPFFVFFGWGNSPNMDLAQWN